MDSSHKDDTVEVTSNPFVPWMLIVFGGIFVCLGAFIMTPFAGRQNVLIGLCMVTLAAGAILGGRIWLRNLPVVMRLTPEGLEIPKKATIYRWNDIDDVAVKTILLNGSVTLLCLRLKADSKERYDIKPDTLTTRAIKAIRGDFDLVFNDRELSTPAEILKTEIENRLTSV